MAESERPDPEVADSGSADTGSPDAPPPARIPPPTKEDPPVLGLSRSWQALTPAGQWFVALAWVALFAAALVGFGLALSGDDGGETPTASSEMTQTTPTTPTEPAIEEPVIEGPVIEEPVIVAPPATEPAPPVTEEAPPPADEGVLPPPVGDPVFEASGEGVRELGEVQIAEDSTIFWTNAGGDFRLQTEQDGVATIVVNSIDAEGESPLGPGTYTLSVVAGGTWSLQIIPS